ncbi:MAG: hypothetical protein O7C56_08140 [Rickettsia endosymbiont of Ixodes persulcatus]|nr:hypothetical protein [Rickettsia endosymbiont of Ixodes persulcatus]
MDPAKIIIRKCLSEKIINSFIGKFIVRYKRMVESDSQGIRTKVIGGIGISIAKGESFANVTETNHNWI